MTIGRSGAAAKLASLPPRAGRSAPIGATCTSIDAAARAVPKAVRFGPGYRLPRVPHRTGYGIVLPMDGPACLVCGDDIVLTPGMCFSDEPMVLVPDCLGIRLENHSHVTDDRAAWFTTSRHAIDDSVSDTGGSV